MRVQLFGHAGLPRRTVRLRLTALYGVLFLLSGAVLLAITNGVGSWGSTGGSSGSSAAVAPAAGGGFTQQQVAQAQANAAVSHQFLIGSVIALGVMTVASVALGWVIAGRVLRPLRTMTAATQRISAENLHERLAVAGPRDELKDLADTIDGLLERLEGAFAAQRRFVANASHELRTPLATMRASLDVAMAKPGPVPAQMTALAGRLRAELGRVDGLLDGFLALARAQHGALPDRAVVSLGEVASAALAGRADAIATRNLAVQVASDRDSTWVEGSRPLLSRMVGNVIDNAIGHNIDGGWIHVTAGADGAAGTGSATGAGRRGGTSSASARDREAIARLVVETGGQVLDQRQVDQLIQPFRRLGADRTGSDNGAGLGLSIVAAIAAAHGGILDLHAREEGGLRVSIALPLAARAARASVSPGVPA